MDINYSDNCISSIYARGVSSHNYGALKSKKEIRNVIDNRTYIPELLLDEEVVIYVYQT